MCCRPGGATHERRAARLPGLSISHAHIASFGAWPGHILTDTGAKNGLNAKRMKGLEPSTFCMASRRSSQLSYSRARREV